jgi:murein DD-endopeptidase MepM/ murein hydrolase activator NlpD
MEECGNVRKCTFGMGRIAPVWYTRRCPASFPPLLTRIASMSFLKRPSLAYRSIADRIADVRPGRWLATAFLAGSAVVAFALVPGDDDVPVPTATVLRELPVPVVAPRAPGVYWHDERVQRGDTIGALLARAGVDDDAAFEFLRADPSARAVYQLRPGRPLRIATDDDGDLVELRFLQSSGDMLTVTRAGDGFAARSAAPDVDTRIAMRSGEIRTSLFAAADTANLPDSVTLALTEIFGGEIDFHHDLRRGDTFTVVYETRAIEGEPAGAGRILAAEFVNQGVAYRAYQWTDPQGESGYYDADGRSLHTAFLRAPLTFSRITSGFTTARFHPILQTWKAHKGTDFGAPTGTPVHVTADGVVEVAGQQTGYGNVIIVRHGKTYSTVYAHLSRFAPALRAGSRVRQGDVIGFVGMTGWATGPHLHYEFRVDGVPRNPVTVALPTAEPVPDAERAKFLADVKSRIGELELARSTAGATFAAAD